MNDSSEYFWYVIEAEYLGLPHTRPYLAIRGSSDLTGLNYASGSCGILSQTGNDYVRKTNHTHISLYRYIYEDSLFIMTGAKYTYYVIALGLD